MITATIGATSLTTRIVGRGHSLVADEPASMGGSDQGFSPLELLAGALASCLTITLRLYASRKSWDLQGVQVEVAIFPDLIRKHIHLQGLLDQEQVDRLAVIAEHCPISKMLAGGCQMETDLSLDK